MYVIFTDVAEDIDNKYITINIKPNLIKDMNGVPLANDGAAAIATFYVKNNFK